eukprot:GILK01010628.1.p1 GENE.GILK01010628.1~~GILK01010628.1.p1  ORF type:complete len:1344 (-),score=277.51 GILK01010628.1:147-4178(-)
MASKRSTSAGTERLSISRSTLVTQTDLSSGSPSDFVFPSRLHPVRRLHSTGAAEADDQTYASKESIWERFSAARTDEERAFEEKLLKKKFEERDRNFVSRLKRQMDDARPATSPAGSMMGDRLFASGEFTAKLSPESKPRTPAAANIRQIELDEKENGKTMQSLLIDAAEKARHLHTPKSILRNSRSVDVLPSPANLLMVDTMPKSPISTVSPIPELPERKHSSAFKSLPSTPFNKSRASAPVNSTLTPTPTNHLRPSSSEGQFTSLFSRPLVSSQSNRSSSPLGSGRSSPLTGIHETQLTGRYETHDEEKPVGYLLESNPTSTINSPVDVNVVKLDEMYILDTLSKTKSDFHSPSESAFTSINTSLLTERKKPRPTSVATDRSPGEKSGLSLHDSFLNSVSRPSSRSGVSPDSASNRRRRSSIIERSQARSKEVPKDSWDISYATDRVGHGRPASAAHSSDLSYEQFRLWTLEKEEKHFLESTAIDGEGVGALNFVTRIPAGRRDVVLLEQWLLQMEGDIRAKQNDKSLNQASRQMEFFKKSQGLYTLCYKELCRQVSVHTVERGHLMLAIWDRLIETLSSLIRFYIQRDHNWSNKVHLLHGQIALLATPQQAADAEAAEREAEQKLNLAMIDHRLRKILEVPFEEDDLNQFNRDASVAVMSFSGVDTRLKSIYESLMNRLGLSDEKDLLDAEGLIDRMDAYEEQEKSIMDDWNKSLGSKMRRLQQQTVAKVLEAMAPPPKTHQQIQTDEIVRMVTKDIQTELTDEQLRIDSLEHNIREQLAIIDRLQQQINLQKQLLEGSEQVNSELNLAIDQLKSEKNQVCIDSEELTERLAETLASLNRLKVQSESTIEDLTLELTRAKENLAIQLIQNQMQQEQHQKQVAELNLKVSELEQLAKHIEEDKASLRHKLQSDMEAFRVKISDLQKVLEAMTEERDALLLKEKQLVITQAKLERKSSKLLLLRGDNHKLKKRNETLEESEKHINMRIQKACEDLFAKVRERDDKIEMLTEENNRLKVYKIKANDLETKINFYDGEYHRMSDENLNVKERLVILRSRLTDAVMNGNLDPETLESLAPYAEEPTPTNSSSSPKSRSRRSSMPRLSFDSSSEHSPGWEKSPLKVHVPRVRRESIHRDRVKPLPPSSVMSNVAMKQAHVRHVERTSQEPVNSYLHAPPDVESSQSQPKSVPKQQLPIRTEDLSSSLGHYTASPQSTASAFTPVVSSKKPTVGKSPNFQPVLCKKHHAFCCQPRTSFPFVRFDENEGFENAWSVESFVLGLSKPDRSPRGSPSNSPTSASPVNMNDYQDTDGEVLTSIQATPQDSDGRRTPSPLRSTRQKLEGVAH